MIARSLIFVWSYAETMPISDYMVVFYQVYPSQESLCTQSYQQEKEKPLEVQFERP